MPFTGGMIQRWGATEKYQWKCLINLKMLTVLTHLHLEWIIVQVTGSLVSSAGDTQDHRAGAVFESANYTDGIM